VAKYVYICSAGHSGSTLLDMVMGSHSRVESLGEISFLSQNLAINLKCSCGSPVRECEVWRKVIGKLSARLGDDIMSHPYRLDMGPYTRAFVTIDHSHQTPLFLLTRKFMLGLEYLRQRFNWRFLGLPLRSVDRALENNFLVYDAVREVLGADIVVDSSKSYLKAVGLYRQNPQDVRIILLTRDGRGVLYSNMRRQRPRGESVRGWVNQYSRALPLFRRHVNPSHTLQVKYEDLAADPPRELARICGFLGISYEPGMLNFASVAHHSTDGNDIRFLRNSEIRLDTRWRQNLSADDLRYFEKRAGALNRELGYA
jgi:hypothetical protein